MDVEGYELQIRYMTNPPGWCFLTKVGDVSFDSPILFESIDELRAILRALQNTDRIALGTIPLQ